MTQNIKIENDSITDKKIQEKYDALHYTLTQSNLIYNFITMENFPQNLRYFDRKCVMENIRNKALEALKQSDEAKKNPANRESGTLFGIVVPILDKFFEDIETDVDNIYTLMQKDNQYKLFIESKNDQYKLNGNCIFLGNIRYNEKNFKVNTSFELPRDEAINETKEFIRSFLIAVTLFGQKQNYNDGLGPIDRNGTLKDEFKPIVDGQYDGYLALRNFIIAGNGDNSCNIRNSIKRINQSNNSFTCKRAMTGCICKYHEFYPSIGSYLTMILKQFKLNNLEYVNIKKLEDKLLIEIKEEQKKKLLIEKKFGIVHIVIIILLVALIIYYTKIKRNNKTENLQNNK